MTLLNHRDIPAEIKIVSFDIFDTLVSRPYKEPHHIFYDVAEKLSTKGYCIDKNTYTNERKDVEYSLRQVKKFKEEITLAEITQLLACRLNLDATVLLTTELECEMDCIYPIPETLQFLNKVLDIGLKVILISDIYLPLEFVSKLLTPILGIDNFNDIEIYLSSEYKKLKSTGELFEIALKSEHLLSHEILHIGDNIISDYDKAKQSGLSAYHYTQTKLTRFEKIPEGNHPANKLSGIIKKTRLSKAKLSESESIIWDISSSVAAPLLIGFCQWLHRELINKDQTRVCFLARDGQILQKVFNILYPEFDTCYLYLSRQSLLFPSITTINKEELAWILARTTKLTLNIVLKRLNLDKLDFEQSIFDPIRSIPLEAQLNERDIELLRSYLLSSPFNAYISPKITSSRNALLLYLKTNNAYEGETLNIVDIGWAGTLQRSLTRVCNFSEINGYYIGVKSNKVPTNKGKMFAYFMDYRKYDSHLKETYLVPFLELFCNADHSGVKGHSISDRKATVQFLPNQASGLKWGVKVQQAAICQFAVYTRDSKLVFSELSNELQTIANLLYELVESPTKQESKVYGAFSDAEDQNESYFLKLASPLNLMHAIQYIFFRKLRHHNEWKAGAIVQSNSFIQVLLRLFGEKSLKRNVAPLRLENATLVKTNDSFVLTATGCQGYYFVYTSNAEEKSLNIDVIVQSKSTGLVKNASFEFRTLDGNLLLTIGVSIGARQAFIRNENSTVLASKHIELNNNSTPISMNITCDKTTGYSRLLLNDSVMCSSNTCIPKYFTVFASVGNTSTCFSKLNVGGTNEELV